MRVGPRSQVNSKNPQPDSPIANTVSVASSEFARERRAVFALKPEELMKLL